MKVSRNGQVSIPAEIRARWKTQKVAIADLGDHLVMAPVPDDAIHMLRGKYKGRGPSTDEIRRLEREEDALRDERRYGPDA
jgi:bifunctional DNA-binding transcriptional regulator/antitoxin component of YhaV-PrlF toxin-antitoxin module